MHLLSPTNIHQHTNIPPWRWWIWFIHGIQSWTNIFHPHISLIWTTQWLSGWTNKPIQESILFCANDGHLGMSGIPFSVMNQKSPLSKYYDRGKYISLILCLTKNASRYREYCCVRFWFLYATGITVCK